MISYGPLQSSAVKERSYIDHLTKGLAIEGTEASALEKGIATVNAFNSGLATRDGYLCIHVHF